jgi:hypothetical protein
MAADSDGRAGEALDRELAGLLGVERFDPPAQFREHRALGDVTTLRDPAVMAELQERVAELQATEE